MVRIINGEIVPDDDPRAIAARSRTQATASTSYATPLASSSTNTRTTTAGGQAPQAPQPQTGISGAFDWNAPPLKLVHQPPGTALLNLPDAAIFGLQVPAKYYCAVIAAVVFLGWRGLLAIPFIWFMTGNYFGRSRDPRRGGSQDRATRGPAR
eukprot:jgi/Chlat1/5735/Chrsp38S05567